MNLIERKKYLNKLLFWIGGIIVSILPVLIISVYHLLDINRPDNFNYLIDIFKNNEMIYILVVGAVTMLFDIIQENKTNILMCFIIIMIVIYSVATYTICTVLFTNKEYENTIDYNLLSSIILWFNVIIFIGILLLGFSFYILNHIKYRKNRGEI